MSIATKDQIRAFVIRAFVKSQVENWDAVGEAVQDALTRTNATEIEGIGVLLILAIRAMRPDICVSETHILRLLHVISDLDASSH